MLFKFIILTFIVQLVQSVATFNKEDAENSLVNLLAPRLLLADKVAQSKWLSGKPIEDPVREQTILDGLTAKGAEAGIDSAWTTSFFTDQFEASKMIQRDFHEKWTSGALEAPTEAIDLDTEVRPSINEIDSQLFEWATVNLDNCAQLSAKSLKSKAHKQYKLNKIHRQAFEKAISHLCPAVQCR